MIFLANLRHKILEILFLKPHDYHHIPAVKNLGLLKKTGLLKKQNYRKGQNKIDQLRSHFEGYFIDCLFDVQQCTHVIWSLLTIYKETRRLFEMLYICNIIPGYLIFAFHVIFSGEEFFKFFKYFFTTVTDTFRARVFRQRFFYSLQMVLRQVSEENEISMRV